MPNSEKLYQRAQKVIPGGVNSPVRSWNSVGGTPLHLASGSGARIWSVEGKELIDFCGSWGPLILGHSDPTVVTAVREAAILGLSFGASTRNEVELAELLVELIPSVAMVRLMSSGTEAVMTAIRLARGYTERSKILKFSGCYHGHSDSMLVSAGSGLLTGGIASSAGVPTALAQETLVAPYNDLKTVEALIATYGRQLAAIIVEPLAGNMGLVKPAPGFLAGLRAMTGDCGALLIFDEVITGFRLAPTTYGALCGITPDLSCLGKIIGGGMPIGAVAGPTAIMSKLAPLGPVYQAGTLSGNPVSVAAGLATLRKLTLDNPYPRIEKLGKILSTGIAATPGALGNRFHSVHAGGMFTIFFAPGQLDNLDQIKNCRLDEYARFFHYMIARGFYLPPSQFEVGFISAAHTEADIQAFIQAIHEF